MPAKSFLLAALLCLLAALPASAGKLRLVAPDYWCPFSCQQNSPQLGFTIDIARAALGHAGYRLDYRNLNYARALQETRRGQYDAIPAVLPAEGRGLILPQEPISRNRYCVYTAPLQRWHYRTPADLDGHRIGLIRGYDYGPALEAWRNRAGASVEQHAGDQVVPRMLDKVRLGRLDALIEDENLVDWLQRGQPRPLRKAGCEAPSWGYLAISPHYPDAQRLAQQFDEGMRRLRRSGELARIMARYGLKGW